LRMAASILIVGMRGNLTVGKQCPGCYKTLFVFYMRVSLDLI